MLRSKFILEVWKEKTVYKIITQELLPKSAFSAAVSRMESTSLTSDPPTGMLLWLELPGLETACHATQSGLSGQCCWPDWSLWLAVIYPLPPTPSEALRALGVSAFSCVTPRFWVLFKICQISCNLHLGWWGACFHSCSFFHSSIPVLFLIFWGWGGN